MANPYERILKCVELANETVSAGLSRGRQMAKVLDPEGFIKDVERVITKARLADVATILETTKISPALFKRLVESKYIFADAQLIANADELVERMATVAARLGNDAAKQDEFLRLCKRLKIRNADTVKGFVYELHFASSRGDLDTVSRILKPDDGTDADVVLVGNILCQCKNYTTVLRRSEKLDAWLKIAVKQGSSVKLVVRDSSLVAQGLLDFIDKLNKNVQKITIVQYPP